MTDRGPFEAPAFQHSSVYVVFVVGDTVSLSPVVDFQPVQPPEAQHPSAVPETVHVSVDELPTVMVVGEAEKLSVGGVATAPAQIVLFHGAVPGHTPLVVCVSSSVPPSLRSKVFAP